MSYIIAFSGKGGTGKTTLAALTVRYLNELQGKPVLAVDADSNSCFNEALGAKVSATIGGMREHSLESVRLGTRMAGMSTEEIFDYQVQQCIVEEKGYDLLAMGRPEGPGCYCAANNIIRKYTDKLADGYNYVVIDNEAGMEHLSRRTAHLVDLMFIVSDPTVKGIKTARRINDLIDELKLDIKNRYLIVNRVRGYENNEIQDAASKEGLQIVGYIPNDDLIFQIDLAGKSVFNISKDSPACSAFYGVLGNFIKA
ncbi:MAG: AAA family ATPase [Candidatus Magnetoovum sp. WYHC-5]|nr:AAA family ATPase [Candidatus Magnetoovum sp. WYHC-5]